jgi:hypothetical protein
MNGRKNAGIHTYVMEPAIRPVTVDNRKKGRVISDFRGADMESDAIYFARRAAQERAAAIKARHPGARQAHLDIADRYDDLIAAISAHERTHGLNGSGRRLEIVVDTRLNRVATDQLG